MHECYEEMFQASTPKVSFYELLKKAETNEQGQKVIPFMDHGIEHKVFDKILEKYMKQVTPKWKRQAFETSIILGCSPRFIKEK